MSKPACINPAPLIKPAGAGGRSFGALCKTDGIIDKKRRQSLDKEPDPECFDRFIDKKTAPKCGAVGETGKIQTA
jgi:hypothetical protein